MKHAWLVCRAAAVALAAMPAAILLPIELLAAVSTPAPERPCTCEAARLDTGWCEQHGIGYVAAIPIRSKLLYETLDAHGHTLDPGAIICERCREAMRTGGYCERDRIGFVKSQAYFSRLTYELARGEKRLPGTIACRGCRQNTGSRGWCGKCGVGMIGAIQMRDREAYAKASAAVDLLIAANTMAARCEGCAVAMLTDSLCPQHRISYRGGKPVVAPVPPGAAPAPD